MEYRNLEIKYVTVEEIYEAIALNGVQHLRGTWTKYNDGKVIGACVLGQGALNLGIAMSLDEDKAADAYYSLEGDGNEEPFISLEAALNTLPAPEKWRSELNQNAGDCIIYWNDRLATNPDGTLRKDKLGRRMYHLRTWESVLKMAKEILEPHFDKTLAVTSLTY